MSSAKAQRRAQARAAREAAERAEREKAARRRRLGILGGVVALAAVVLVAVIALSSSGSDDDEPRRASAPAASLAGIPQDGWALGDPDAPVTIEEYADLQCPVCAQFSAEALPQLVDEYVRPGRVRLVLRPLTFIGEDSVRGARAAGAAAQQDRAWGFVERFYAQQGEENSGYATDAFLREVAGGVQGLDVARLLGARDSEAVTGDLEQAQQAADRLGVQGTPSFAVGPTGGDLELVELQSLGIDDLREPIEEAGG